MAIQLQLVGHSPQNNPDRLFFQATFSGDYGVAGGTGDTLNLAPYASGSNPTGFTDPQLDYGEGLNALPKIPPSSFAENLVGGYTEAYLGATLETCILRCFAAGGVELTQGAAYPANYLAGKVFLEVLIPVRIAS